jgi:ABC-type molybdate transport system substrate-binding protein
MGRVLLIRAAALAFIGTAGLAVAGVGQGMAAPPVKVCAAGSLVAPLTAVADTLR